LPAKQRRILLGLTPHPALPVVREDFFEAGAPCTVLDWVDGTDLQTLIQTKGTPGLTPSSVLASQGRPDRQNPQPACETAARSHV
jgi:hypothetical protein